MRMANYEELLHRVRDDSESWQLPNAPAEYRIL